MGTRKFTSYDATLFLLLDSAGVFAYKVRGSG